MDMVRQKLEQEILRYLPPVIRNTIAKAAVSPEIIEEIRIRADRPVMLGTSKGDFFVTADGTLSDDSSRSLTACQDDLMKILELMSASSFYAYQDEIKSGYITLRGGHRAGLTGRIVLSDDGIKNIKDISGVNIRVAREIPGCSAKVMKYLLNGSDICNALIISPPQCGKTTILRDIARNLSNGTGLPGIRGVKVGIVDERSEIAACYKGVPQHDVGLRTDVLDGCPKSLGMPLMLRSMSPQVIITDEIGGNKDGEAIMAVINAGVKIIASAHGFNISELRSRREVLTLLQDRIFERYIVLSSFNGPGTLEEVVDGTTLKSLYRRVVNAS